MQGSYIDIPLMSNAQKFELELLNHENTYVGLSEVEIYAGGSNVFDRYVSSVCVSKKKRRKIIKSPSFLLVL